MGSSVAEVLSKISRGTDILVVVSAFTGRTRFSQAQLILCRLSDGLADVCYIRADIHEVG